MQDSLPAGWLRLCRAGVEPAGSLREVSVHGILLSRAYPGAITVRVPGDGIHAVATGVTQFRGKALPSDRSTQSVAALIPRAPNGYPPQAGPIPRRRASERADDQRGRRRFSCNRASTTLEWNSRAEPVFRRHRTPRPISGAIRNRRRSTPPASSGVAMVRCGEPWVSSAPDSTPTTSGQTAYLGRASSRLSR